MRITNLDSGEAYHLKPDTKIEVERTNPFFNDYGEQTTPLELPGSERNRRLLGFPDSFGRRVKMQPVNVSIQDGEYFAQCRQIVLGAQYKGSISTSFYINDGSFYSRIQNVRLKDIFKDEYVEGVSNVDQAIQFCRGLRLNTSEQFTIFPILVTDDSGVDVGMNFKMVNAFGKDVVLPENSVWVWKDGQYQKVTNPSVTIFHPDTAGSDCDFYNAVQRTEYVNQVAITIAPGYYISPFIRANYLLRRLFAYFGYTLKDNFFTTTSPFNKMAVVNNVIDILVNGRIRVADMVPDVSCADFLSVFRKKFCCEFTSDEGTRTADIVFLRDILAVTPAYDLTHCMTSEPDITYKSEKDYQRVVLSSEDKVDSSVSSSYDDMASMVTDSPGAYFSPSDGAFYKTGFSGDYSVKTKIGECSQDYNTGEEMEAKEVKIPDLMPEFRLLQHSTMIEDTSVVTDIGDYLYVGDYATLNSKMEMASNDGESSSDAAAKQKTSLAFTYLATDGRPEGTVSPYDMCSNSRPVPIFDYALYYHGPSGIFEKFWRDYDNLLRNSLHEMKVKLLLTQSQKQNIPSMAKVVIRGIPFFFNKLKFVLGGKNEPVESELRTISPMEPSNYAPLLQDQLPAMNASYKWVGKSLETEVTDVDYNNSGLDKDRTFTTIYPPLPSAEFEVSTYGKYALQKSFTSQLVRKPSFWHHSKYKYTKTEVWLECVAI